MVARRPEPSGDPTIVTGIKKGFGADGSFPVRREIDEWWFSKDIKDKRQRSLFILGLTKFQERGRDPDHKDDRSFAAIAGIHGLPVSPWPHDADERGFYCSHGKVTFPTWHTPYMLLYEQRLYEEMVSCVPLYYDEKDWENMYQAADTWRLPFWDWAMKKPDWNANNPKDPVNRVIGLSCNVPFVITQKTVKVKTNKGTQRMANPMFQYSLKEGKTFKNLNVWDDPKAPDHSDANKRPWIGYCRVTSRHPEHRDKHPVQDNDELKEDFKKHYVDGGHQDWKKITGQLRGSVDDTDDGKGGKTKREDQYYFANTLPEAVYRLFRCDESGKPETLYRNFATQEFSGSKKSGLQDIAYPSLESLHNNLHDFAGGNGFMGDPATAGFDPVFWMHHCNTDRLLAIWQDLYEDQVNDWLEGRDGIENQQEDYPDTALKPFRHADKSYFTSRTAMWSHRKYGYTYPELQPQPGQSTEEYIKSIRTKIQRKYCATPLSALLVPENREAAKKLMDNMTRLNLSKENFPNKLLTEEYCPESLVKSLDKLDDRVDELAKRADETNDENELEAILSELESITKEIPQYGEPPEEVVRWSYSDYVVNVVYERFALGGQSYAITFFLGEVPDHKEGEGNLEDFDFAKDESAVGRVYNFSSPAETIGGDITGCASCRTQKDARMLSTGQFILTDYLIERLSEKPDAGGHEPLSSLKEKDVLPWLKEHFHYRVTDHNNIVLTKDDHRLDRLAISISHSKGTHSSNPDEPTKYGAPHLCWVVKEGTLHGQH